MSHEKPAAFALPLLAVILAFALTIGSAPAIAGEPQPAVVHQLRIYEIFEGNKHIFHQRFRDHAMRIMARYDFKILSM